MLAQGRRTPFEKLESRNLMAADFTVTGTYSIDIDADGAIDYSDQFVETLDARGKLVSSVTGLGSGYVLTTTNTYNKRGDLAASVVDGDYFHDGVIDIRITTDYEYDLRGRLIGVTDAYDFGLDGPDYTYTLANSYDHKGRLESSLSEEHIGGLDGPVGFTVASTYKYNLRGLLVEQVDDLDFEGDGVLDSRYTYSHSYNARGLKTHSSIVEDFALDGIIDNIFASDYTYNGRGDLVAAIDEYDYGADGVLDERSFTKNTYGLGGNLRESVIESDYAADGTIDARTIVTRSRPTLSKLV